MQKIITIICSVLFAGSILFAQNNMSSVVSKGYFGQVGLTVPSGFIGSYTGATLVNGYRFLPQFAMGGGIGVLGDVVNHGVSVPVFLHLRTDILDGKVSPYVALDIGYHIPLTPKYAQYEGWFLAPSAGVGIKVGDRYRILAGLEYAANSGWNFRQDYMDKVENPGTDNRYNYLYWYPDKMHIRWFHALNLKIAFAW